VLPLHGENLELDVDELRARCREWKEREHFPLRAIIACSPANPTGKFLAELNWKRSPPFVMSLIFCVSLMKCMSIMW
jgi:aspartate/methionine/tyrosine aminotransferase